MSASVNQKIPVRFLVDGRWADEPWEPVFEVKEGDVVSVSPRTAKVAIDAGKAESVDGETPEDRRLPADDRLQSSQGPAAGEGAGDGSQESRGGILGLFGGGRGADGAPGAGDGNENPAE